MTARNDKVVFQASQNLILQVEIMVTGEQLLEGKKVKFEPCK